MGFHFHGNNLLDDSLGGNDAMGDVFAIERQSKLRDQLLTVGYGARGDIHLDNCVPHDYGFAATRGHYGHDVYCPFPPGLETAFFDSSLVIS